MFWRKRHDKSFVPVAASIILVGAIIFVFGALGWWVNVTADNNIIAMPSVKVIGGIIIMALGYIQLELGLLRDK